MVKTFSTMTDKTPFSFCIAFRWEADEPYSPMGTYTIHNQNVFYGNLEYAQKLCNHVQTVLDKNENRTYDIYKLTKIDDNESSRTD